MLHPGKSLFSYIRDKPLHTRIECSQLGLVQSNKRNAGKGMSIAGIVLAGLSILGVVLSGMLFTAAVDSAVKAGGNSAAVQPLTGKMKTDVKDGDFTFMVNSSVCGLKTSGGLVPDVLQGQFCKTFRSARRWTASSCTTPCYPAASVWQSSSPYSGTTPLPAHGGGAVLVDETVRLCRMNLSGHGLGGCFRQGELLLRARIQLLRGPLAMRAVTTLAKAARNRTYRERSHSNWVA